MKQKSKRNQCKLPPSLQAILTEEELSVYEDYYENEATKQVRLKLVEYLDSKLRGNILKTDKENKYEIPAWSEYQADAIGYRRALRDLINLLK